MDRTLAEDLSAVARIAVVKQILEVVCRTTGLGFSAVARVTETHWIACAVRDEIAFGLKPGGELEIGTTICNEIRQSGKIVAIDHVAEDKDFCAHATPKMYGFQSYISVPIMLSGGRFFGTLCGIDPKPARVKTPEVIGMFELFADLIAQHLEAQERMTASENALLIEREIAQLREQFIAVLGHDLRNPLAAISSGAELLKYLPPGEEANETVAMIQSSAGRMAGLIDNLMDFARGRLGGGLSIARVADAELADALEHVVLELEMAGSGRTIERHISIDRPVFCDRARIGQMLSNLLANALVHGSADGPVTVIASSRDGRFELSVNNCGQTIPPQVLEQIFKPFSRGTARPGQQGLGLGLYIAAEIARAHDGALEVNSAEGTTSFVFRMPLAAGS